MAGIYIHIPYCKQACHYCNFHFSTNLNHKSELLIALQREIELRREFTADERIETIYLGGGTPSLLSASELESLFATVYDNFTVSSQAEITLEANPDDLSLEYLSALADGPVNRLSIGVQSFNDSELQWMNRAHSASEALEAIRAARSFGFDSLSIDLIFGLPSMSLADWQANLDQAFSLGIPHLSTYGLTVEEGTALGSWVAKGRVQPLAPAQFASQFEYLCEALEQRGYEHYEISNSCLPGKRARHNSAYWTGEIYLGIGPGAHSYDGQDRYWNISHNHQYVEAIGRSELPLTHEKLSLTDRANELIMVGLRTSDGLSLDALASLSTSLDTASVLQEAQPYLESGHLLLRDETLVLSRSGRMIADRIMSDLFL